MVAIHSLADRPDLLDAVLKIYATAWRPRLPPSASAHLLPRMLQDLSRFMLVAVSDPEELPLAYAAGLPIAGPCDVTELPDGGYDAVFDLGVRTVDEGLIPRMFSALAIAVAPEHQGQGVSASMAKALCELAVKHGLSDLVVPVRPSRKAAEPFTRMEEYARRVREDGLPADPWIRLHARLGASIVKVCPESMVMRATVRVWEHATGISFPRSGVYAVPGGLAPLSVDRERDEAVLIEPNVWMHYRLR